MRIAALRRRPLLVSFQLGEQYLLNILGYGEAPDHYRPELNWRRGKQVLKQRHEVKIVVEVRSKSAMLCAARDTWMAFAIMADATKVLPGGISEEDVGSEVNGLS
jgi:hypothetical protein